MALFGNRFPSRRAVKAACYRDEYAATDFTSASGCKYKVLAASTPLSLKPCAASVLMAINTQRRTERRSPSKLMQSRLRVQLFLPQKSGTRENTMVFVVAIVVGYAHLSRPSRAVGIVSFVNPEEVLCKWKGSVRRNGGVH